MEITGLLRIRNESAIINDTLDNMATFCSRIIVFDDCSTDATVDICRHHPAVDLVICSAQYAADRPNSETDDRRILLGVAQRLASPNSWIVLMDGDERIEFDWNKLTEIPLTVTGIRMKLFDYYITADDVDKPYSERRWLGPEYRDILMVFRNTQWLVYNRPIQRSPIVAGTIIDAEGAFVKHYGKALSVEAWDAKCNYYANNFPNQYSKKWKARRGKAIHTSSDFGRELITWAEKETKGIKLY